MKTERQNKMVLWIVVILAIINLSALATFYFVNYRNNRETATTEKPGGSALQSELGLTAEQGDKVSTINADYKRLTEPIVDSIRETKSRLLAELSKESSDTGTIRTILNILGMHQHALQMANVNQFLELKKVCNTQQTQKLSQIYSELYGCAGAGKGHGEGKGQGKGMKHRHRYGQRGNSN